MKYKSIIFIILVVILLALSIFFSAIFFSVKHPAQKSHVLNPSTTKLQTQPAIRQEIPIFPSGTFPIDAKPVNVSLEGVKEKSTVSVSWDDSQVNAFYLVVFDVELFKTHTDKALVWVVSSLQHASLPAGVITKQDTMGFIPSGYKIGAVIPGFHHNPSVSEGVQLTVGKKYYLQMNGFTKKGDVITVNKEFTFTNSCLSPNCK